MRLCINTEACWDLFLELANCSILYIHLFNLLHKPPGHVAFMAQSLEAENLIKERKWGFLSLRVLCTSRSLLSPVLSRDHQSIWLQAKGIENRGVRP